jgi:hypothetical protein
MLRGRRDKMKMCRTAEQIVRGTLPTPRHGFC